MSLKHRADIKGLLRTLVAKERITRDTAKNMESGATFFMDSIGNDVQRFKDGSTL
jgi:hypothetical protein